MIVIRPLQAQDIPALSQIDPSFIAHTVLRITRQGDRPFAGWQVQEEPLAAPFHKGRAYDFDPTEQANIRARHEAGHALQLVLEDAGHIRGILDVAQEDWRRTAWIWNLMLDQSIRGQGYGRLLIDRTIQWAKTRRLWAILLETQSNNTPANHFYAHMGFELIGVNELFYTDHDSQRDEIALFWGLKIR